MRALIGSIKKIFRKRDSVKDIILIIRAFLFVSILALLAALIIYYFLQPIYF
jgi:hypothetical protein